MKKWKMKNEKWKMTKWQNEKIIKYFKNEKLKKQIKIKYSKN
jgi:hypothetical protein